MYNIASKIVDDVLTYKIDTEEPLEIDDLKKSLKSLSDGYIKFSKLKNINVKVSEVRKGSFEFDLILSSVAPVLPLMSNVNTTVDFIKRIVEVTSFFKEENTSKIIKPTIEEAKMVNSLSKHSQNVYNGCTINIYDDCKKEEFKLTDTESKIVSKNSKKFIEKEKLLEKEEKKPVFRDRVVKFVQTRKDNRDYGNKSICDNLSNKEIKTIFKNKKIKNEILDNPYHYVFVVDIEVQYIDNEIILYNIIKLNDKIEI